MLSDARVLSPREQYIEQICENKNLYYRLAWSFLKNDADVMDAISQMTIVVLEKHESLRDPEAFFPWSKKILINICRTRLRELKRVSPEEYAPDLAESHDPDLSEQMTIKKYISALPPKHKEVVILRFYHDMDYAQIGEMLNVPLGTVKSRLNRAIQTLKQEIGGEMNA